MVISVQSVLKREAEYIENEVKVDFALDNIWFFSPAIARMIIVSIIRGRRKFKFSRNFQQPEGSTTLSVSIFDLLGYVLRLRIGEAVH